MYRTRHAIYLSTRGTAVLADHPDAVHPLYPADYPVPRRTAERYGLPALDGAVTDDRVPFSDDVEEKAQAAPPATKARSGPAATKTRGFVGANAQPEQGSPGAQRENSA